MMIYRCLSPPNGSYVEIDVEVLTWVGFVGQLNLFFGLLIFGAPNCEEEIPRSQASRLIGPSIGNGEVW